MAWLQSAIPFIGIILLFQKTTAANPSQRFHLIADSLTWHEAQSFCRVKHADLATVNHMDDKNELDKTLGGRTMLSWIGLLRGGTRRWMWSDGRGAAHFTHWGGGGPSNDNGIEWCGEISQTTWWNDLSCGEENDFVCYERQPFRYVHYKEGQSWVASQELCRSKHTDLAYVTTSPQNSQIADLVKSWTGIIGFNNKAWFGLFNDAWMWSDGGQTSFRYWQSGKPNGGSCAAVSASEQGRWVDINCNSKTAFVCQGGLKVKKMVIRIKLRSDADLTDSAVSDTILKEFETRLKDRYVTDFSVRWRSDKNGVVFQRQEQQEVAEKTGY
ncbi:macrophage mannose receptor 1-like [Acanthopagrus schlegelii]